MVFIFWVYENISVKEFVHRRYSMEYEKQIIKLENGKQIGYTRMDGDIFNVCSTTENRPLKAL